MALPAFTADCSLYAEKQHDFLNINIFKMDQIVRPQFNGNDCYESCRDSCCICLHDTEGIIESSCYCDDQCISNCINRCNKIFTNNIFD